MDKGNILRALISAVAVAAVVVKIVYPNAVDVITLGLIVLAFVPWLAPIVKSLELTGLGKVEFRELIAKVDEAKGAASNADRKAELALAGARSAGEARQPDNVETPEQELGRLVEEYNRIRATQPAGALRTSSLTDVASRMVAVAPKLTRFDVKEALLNEDDDGRRLAGYVYLYAAPDANHLGDLVRSVKEIDRTPFGQYWGLQAVGRVIERNAGGSVSSRVFDQLNELLARLKPGTDRYYVLNNIIKALKA